jgi:5-methylcytosine-specific restriction endonuclease McrA
MSLLETECLKLNKQWVPLGVISVRQAFLDAAAGAVTLLRFYKGYPTPYRWEDWISLPVADKDEFIPTSKNHELRKIAVPRVAICTSFDRIISKEQKLNTRNVARRDKGICAVSGQKLTPDRYSIEHIRPRSKGGQNDWRNVRLMDKRLNSARGNKSYRKLGLRKPKSLPEPRPSLPFHGIVNRNHYPEWRLFQIPEPNESEPSHRAT